MARPGLLEKRRQEFARHLIRSLDVLSYCHLMFIYFMDISLLRLLVRGIVQLNYLTPKPFPIPRAARTRTVYFVILGASLYCFAVHLFFALPVSREANAGYLHGGLTIQFVGQKAPTSRIQLLWFDIIVAVLQLAMLTISVNLHDDSAGTTPPAPPTTFAAAASLAARTAERAEAQEEQARMNADVIAGDGEDGSTTSPQQQQTIDDEERGQLSTTASTQPRSRQPSTTVHTVSSHIAQTAPNPSSEPASTSSSPSSSSRPTYTDDLPQLLQSPNELDGFSGEVIAAELHIIDMLGRSANTSVEALAAAAASTAVAPAPASATSRARRRQ
ncbi:uncharacterized protein V1518DRAFT_414114 [Limtongia smithiae]|uniref:uncharacterized protein n=1 Tax=Limtongia smithiae TaxID=1125753 RepID=UPI0034D020E8